MTSYAGIDVGAVLTGNFSIYCLCCKNGMMVRQGYLRTCLNILKSLEILCTVFTVISPTILPAAIITTSYCTSYLNKFPSAIAKKTGITYDILAKFKQGRLYLNPNDYEKLETYLNKVVI